MIDNEPLLNPNVYIYILINIYYIYTYNVLIASFLTSNFVVFVHFTSQLLKSFNTSNESVYLI